MSVIPVPPSPADFERLKATGTTESRHLDYKVEMEVWSHDGKFELLKDVSAMANGSGGVILFGVEEDDAGAPAALPGLELEKLDDIRNHIDQVLASGLDQPIPGVLHGPIERPDGRYYYYLSVARSPLAPHMITMATKRPRFYARLNTVNAPLTATQIKEIAVRHSDAEVRALTIVETRLRRLPIPSRPWYVLHAIPLFSEPYALDITDPAVTKELTSLGSGNVVYNVDGYSVVWSTEVKRNHVLFTRSGAFEAYRHPIDHEGRRVAGPALRNELNESLSKLRELEIPGLVSPPFLMHLHLGSMEGTSLIKDDRFQADSLCAEQQIAPEALVVQDWNAVRPALKHMMDYVWQAFGEPNCPKF